MNKPAFAETLPDDTRRQYRIYAIIASCFGCIGDLLQDSSAILMLYFLALGASKELTMFQFAFPGIASLLLLIPAAGIVARFGTKRIIFISCMIAMSSYLLMSAAPFFGKFSENLVVLEKYWVAFWCFVYCSARILWSGAWFPFINYVLRAEERAPFFGMLRFVYYIVIGILFYIVGHFMTADAPIWFLQIVLASTGLLALGRWFFIKRIKIRERRESKKFDLIGGLKTALGNQPLIRFSIYICIVMVSSAAITPLAIMYLKDGFHCGDGLVQITSTFSLAGNVAGFLLLSLFGNRMGPQRIQLWTNIVFILVPLILFFCGDTIVHPVPVIAALLFLCNLAWAMIYASMSAEMLTLAKPGNATMATSVCQTFQQFGIAGGRVLSSALVECTFLAAFSNAVGLTVSNYQMIFLIFAGISLLALILLPVLRTPAKN